MNLRRGCAVGALLAVLGLGGCITVRQGEAVVIDPSWQHTDNAAGDRSTATLSTADPTD